MLHKAIGVLSVTYSQILVTGNVHASQQAAWEGVEFPSLEVLGRFWTSISLGPYVETENPCQRFDLIEILSSV